MRKKLILNISFLLILTMLFANSVVLAKKAKSAAEIYTAFKAKKCRMCHKEHWNEWEKSQHAKAWTDPIFQEEASKHKDREQKCDGCHAPEPIFTGEIGRLLKRRTEQLESGVTCLVCHMDAEGNMHGPEPTKKSTLHGIVTEEQMSVNQTIICATCHGQKTVPLHNQMLSFKDSSAAKEGKTCATCHMPEIERKRSIMSPKKVKSRTHIFLVGENEALLKSAATLDVKIDGGKAMVNITNKASHLLPGTALRTIILDVKVSDASGKEVLHKQEMYTQPYEEGATGNRIQPGEVRSHTYDTGGLAKGKVEVKLLYKRLPKTPDSELIVMAEAQKSW